MTTNFWQDRIFVVTGGGRGQGAAEVTRLLASGAKVVVADMLTPDDPQWSVVGGERGTLSVVTADVSRAPSWQLISEAVEQLGGALSGLVNNAGITLRKTVTETTLEEWRTLLGINLDAAFLGIRQLAPLMVDGGSIVNISSTAGLTGYFSAAYTASKWAIRGLTRAAAVEFASRGIRVNTICPGLIDTPLINQPNGGFERERAAAFFDSNRKMTALDRAGQPDEVAGAVMFLLGPDSRFITGTDLVVDGGMIGAGIYTRIGRDIGKISSP